MYSGIALLYAFIVLGRPRKHSSWIVRLNLSKWPLSEGLRTLLCLWTMPCLLMCSVNQVENSGPWSDCSVEKEAGKTLLASETNRKLLWVLMRPDTLAHAHLEKTSSRV